MNTIPVNHLSVLTIDYLHYIDYRPSSTERGPNYTIEILYWRPLLEFFDHLGSQPSPERCDTSSVFHFWVNETDQFEEKQVVTHREQRPSKPTVHYANQPIQPLCTMETLDYRSP